MLIRDGIAFSLDSSEAVQVNSSDYVLTGWSFTTNHSHELKVIACVDNVEYPAFVGFPRPDVAEHFKNPLIDHCGFVIRFRCKRVPTSIVILGRVSGRDIVLEDSIQIPNASAASAGSRSNASSYQQWIRWNEPKMFWHDQDALRYASTLTYRPTISIILPTYNTPPYFLSRCIQSVLDQQYWNWQLCISDDNSSEEYVVSTIRQFAQNETRICVDQSIEQGGISVASNIALSHASGDFVVLLDHDDELHPSALLEIVRALNEGVPYQLLYSDEDKIDGFGLRSQPAFKPDFDKNIFLSFNYLGHLIALKRTLVEEIGGFRRSCDGAQDWDLLIRAIEIIPENAIYHIRKPLYHWRMHSASTSVSLDAKPYAAKSWVRVLEDHAKRTEQDVTITQGLFYGSMRVKYPAPDEIEVGVFVRPIDGIFQAAIIKMNAGRRALHLYQVIECAIFEFDSGKEAEFTHAPLTVSNECLSSLTEIHCDVFVFINGPLESLNHFFFDELVAQSVRSDCGLVTGMALDTQNRIIPTALIRTDEGVLTDPFAGIQIPDHGYMGQVSVVRAIDACSEFFFAVRRELLADIGGTGAISSSHMQELAKLLSTNARKKHLSVLYTPYAVASFASIPKHLPQQVVSEGEIQMQKLNSHLLSFNDSLQTLGSTGRL